MKTFNDLKKYVELTENKYNSLNEIAHEQLKERGVIESDLCKEMNAILFSLSNAYECLEKGFKGEF